MVKARNLTALSLCFLSISGVSSVKYKQKMPTPTKKVLYLFVIVHTQTEKDHSNLHFLEKSTLLLCSCAYLILYIRVSSFL